MLLVKFFAEAPTSPILNYAEYVEDICKTVYDSGLVSNYEYNISWGDGSIADSIETPEDDEWVWIIQHREKEIDRQFTLAFKLGTYSCSTQFTVEVRSSDYVPTPNDKYLEQLKLTLKKKIIKQWDKVVWLVDEDAAILSMALYPQVYVVENLARQLINELMTKEYGTKWWDSFVPIEIKNKHSARFFAYKKSVPDFNNIDERLLSIDITDLLCIFTYEKKKWVPVPDIEIDRFLSGLIDLPEELIKNKIRGQSTVELDLWQDQFSKYLPSDFIDRFKTFAYDRNHVAHNKLLDRNIYTKILSMAVQLKSDLESALDRINKLIISQEQKEHIAQEERRIEEEAAAFAESIIEIEASINIRKESEIIELINDVIYERYHSIINSLRFRSDVEVSNLDELDCSNLVGTLFEVTYRITQETILIKYEIGSIDSSQGGVSTVRVFIANQAGEELDIDCVVITYFNGEAEYNDNVGCFVPITQDDISESNNIAIWIVKFIEDNFENLREKVDADMYAIIKDGGNSPIIELECCECGEPYICINEDYAAFGTCLNCGAHNEIVKCDRCEIYFEGEDCGDVNLCEHCLEYIEAQ